MAEATRAKKSRFFERPEGLPRLEKYFRLKIDFGGEFTRSRTLTHRKLAERLRKEAKVWRARQSPSVPFLADLFEFLADWVVYKAGKLRKLDHETLPSIGISAGPCDSCGPFRINWSDEIGACSMCFSPPTGQVDPLWDPVPFRPVRKRSIRTRIRKEPPLK